MKKMSIFALLLAAVLVTSYSVSGTYAKYTSTFEGTADTARVAKWAFEVNDQAVTNSFTFDLFNTVKDSDANNTESDVKNGGAETIIAPGTQGSFDIKLENLSEVNAKYTVDYTVEKTANIPVEFSVNGGTTWTTDLADVAATDIAMNGGQTTITVQWRWVYEIADDAETDGVNEATQNDVSDTTLGAVGTDTITVKADITVTQVD